MGYCGSLHGRQGCCAKQRPNRHGDPSVSSLRLLLAVNTGAVSNLEPEPLFSPNEVYCMLCHSKWFHVLALTTVQRSLLGPEGEVIHGVVCVCVCLADAQPGHCGVCQTLTLDP